jgi:hypothetical protein
MDDNVVSFPGATIIAAPVEEEVKKFTAKDILSDLEDLEFNDIMIIGRLDGGALYFATSSGDPAKILLDLESTKYIVMDAVMSEEYED